MAFGQENASLRRQNHTFIALTTPIYGSVCPDRSDGRIWQYAENAQARRRRKKKATNNYARN
jgi:hypothetical protein